MIHGRGDDLASYGIAYQQIAATQHKDKQQPQNTKTGTMNQQIADTQHKDTHNELSIGCQSVWIMTL